MQNRRGAYACSDACITHRHRSAHAGASCHLPTLVDADTHPHGPHACSHSRANATAAHSNAY